MARQRLFVVAVLLAGVLLSGLALSRAAPQLRVRKEMRSLSPVEYRAYAQASTSRRSDQQPSGWIAQHISFSLPMYTLTRLCCQAGARHHAQRGHRRRQAHLWPPLPRVSDVHALAQPLL